MDRLITALLVGWGVGMLLAWALCRAAETDARLAKEDADAKLLQSIHDGTYRIPPEKAQRVMRDIMRPMGARPAEDALSLSTTADVQRLRAWRQRRAVTGLDHHTRHFAEGAIPSEWARSVMEFCVSDRETMEGE